MTQLQLDWSLCIICQTFTDEELKCPLNSKYPDPEARYNVCRSFMENLNEFQELNAMPVTLQFDCYTIDIKTLCDNSASWHESCHLKFSSSKLQKSKDRMMRKRRLEEMTDGEQASDSSQSVRVKRHNLALTSLTQVCIFCGGAEEHDKLHSFTSLKLDKKIREMAGELEDFDLLSRISVGGDLIAMEAKYHLNPCLTSFRNRHRSLSLLKNKTFSEDEMIDESRAFVELVEHIEQLVEKGTYMFKLSDLHTTYVRRLQDLGINKEIHKTRLKRSLLDHFDEVVQEQNDGRNVILVFEEGMNNILKEAFNGPDISDEVAILAKAAAIIRKDMFSHKGFEFSGTFPSECQESSLPHKLKLMVSMLLNGLDIKDQEKQETQPCLTVCQTVLFNAKKRVYKTKTDQSRHTAAREPPLPIFLGFSVHSMTRSKTLITKLYQLGLSVSYDRIMEIEESLATSVSERFNEDGCVAPACLKRGLFSVDALDNIDHNPSSTTSSSSFHGTGISIFQCPTTRNPGESRPPIIIHPSGTERHSLPESFSVVPPVALAEHSVSVPACNTVPVQRCVNEAKAQEAEWVSHVLSQLGNSNVTGEDNLAWSAYHSSIQQPTIHLPAVTALLPLFYEKAATPAMIKHGMDVTREAITFLNPGQIPVITLDQPLFALAKTSTVQWKWPDSYGEQKYVVMFGGLHLEMTLWNTLGDLLKSSGWTTALTQAEVASTGVAEAFLTASHVARTRHAHQVSVIALQNLKKEALMASHNHNHEVSMIDWEESMKEQSPTFLFWEMIIRYQTLILIFIRAHRQRNFSLYVDVLERLVPLFFALDHINYARWVPIHIRDMKALPDSIRQEFQERHHWVLSRTNRPFSAMPIDQVHEQENKRVN